MRMLNIYKSDKYRSMIYRISQKQRNDRKIKTVKFLFMLSIYIICFHREKGNNFGVNDLMWPITEE